MIFDTFIDDYVEFSKTDKSIYDELKGSSEKIYLAPTYYFYKRDNYIYDLYNDKKVAQIEVEEYKKCEEKLKQSYIQIKISDREIRSMDDDPVYITHRYYFDNLRYNIGSNTTTSYTGSCSYVALGMILSYYDSILNDNVIPETYDITSTKSFSTYNSINLASYNVSPGIDDSFHSDLIQLGRDLGLTETDSNSIAVSDMDELFEEYFNDRGLSITTHTTGFFTNKINFCKTAIDSDNPVYVGIVGIDTTISPNSLNHGVVGYGYDNTGIYVHFGWKNNYHTNTNINNYTIDSAFYINLNSNHNHSNNYLWNYNGCSGTVCSCGDKTCYHGSYYYSQLTSTKHQKICHACGYYQNENHHFSTINGEQVCSDCGYIEQNHQHNYIYSWVNYNQHRRTCICGVTGLQPHALSPDAFSGGEQYAECLLCHGLASVGVMNMNGSSQFFPRTVNGSFLLPNGVIVLENEDLKAYLEGTLIFNYYNNN